jgi:sugar lactone lactonase YvrE
MLGGPDRRTLCIVAREWHGLGGAPSPERTGQILTVEVEVPGAGRP